MKVNGTTRLLLKGITAALLLFALPAAAWGHAGTGLNLGQPKHVQQKIKLDRKRFRIVVHPGDNSLTLWNGQKLVKKFRIAMGTEETPSPVGDWIVISKGRNWGSGFGTRWIGLNVPWGVYGIHGTNRPESIGRKASHGCIRMHNRDVEELYRVVKIGTPVSIVGHPLGDPSAAPRILSRGAIGSDVLLIQSRLRSAGYYHGAVNGRYGPLTEKAVRRFEVDYGLSVNGRFSLKDFIALGLIE